MNDENKTVATGTDTQPVPETPQQPTPATTTPAAPEPTPPVPNDPIPTEPITSPAAPSLIPESTQPSVTPPVIPPAQPVTTPMNKPTGGKGKFLWFTLIALVLIGIVGGIFFFLQTKNFFNQQKTANQDSSLISPKIDEIVVGTDPTFSPMEYKDSKGNLVGYDIDLTNRLSQEMGVKIKVESIPWDNLFDALQNKKIDMIISGVTITDDRKKLYAFSDPYINAGQVIVTTKANVLIKAPTDLKGKRVGVQSGTTNETEALKYTPSSDVIRFPDFVQAAKALNAGTIDAIVSDLPGAEGIVSANPNLKIASDPFTNEYYGIVFRKDEQPLLAKVNTALYSLQQQGIFQQLKARWFAAVLSEVNNLAYLF